MAPVLYSLPEEHLLKPPPLPLENASPGHSLKALPKGSPENSFLSPLSVTERPVFLLAAYREPERHILIRKAIQGFEQRLAQLGGHVAFHPLEPKPGPATRINRPEVRGIFFFHTRDIGPLFRIEGQTSTVLFGSEINRAGTTGNTAPLAHINGAGVMDSVDFDDTGGGTLATRHLLSLGYRRIAFLGAHSATPPHQPYVWSDWRKEGWRRTMRSALQAVEGMDYSIPVKRHRRLWDRDGRVCAEAPGSLADISPEARNAVCVLTQLNIDAVVAASAAVAHEWLQGLDFFRIPDHRRPAMVAFDVRPNQEEEQVSYVALPWDRLGTEAAQLLWERSQGRLPNAQVRRMVPLQLIPRLAPQSHNASAAGASGSGSGSMGHPHVANALHPHPLANGPVLLTGRVSAQRLRHTRRQG